MNKHRHSLLLVVTALLLAIDLMLRILWGYTSGDILTFFAMDVVAGILLILITVCIAVTILSIVKHQHWILFTFFWVFIAILGVLLNRIPIGHFETLGGLLSLYNASPDQILNDARTLGDEFAPMTCFGDTPQRYPCDNPISRDKLSSSIRNMHVRSVLILDDYILIEKFGLEGVFRGFVVFREGSDIWKNQDAITRSGCGVCWKIRILDGLYWYTANPSDRPIFIEALK
jgi:hypothetical protein